ncbi:GTP cyclohydrolase 1 type 2 [Bombiscardovia apis]|uniref:GTP cyclohydrolase 1 type 2 homolog n=2 Tax=Bombiscardovia apis TaxID=2932182 RepID=A0ABM8BCB2_9BIFI|nr:GTP cyclohydrolase 1 type 2 [Bombiscardovia apis]
MQAETSVSLGKAVEVLEQLYPLSYAEDWDHPGLIVGEPSWPVSTIYCAVDPTLEIIDEAIAAGAQLLICHHPLFFRSINNVSGFGVHGAIVNRLVEAHCGLWVGHTNADAAVRGVAQAAADAFGLSDQRPLQAVAFDSHDWHAQTGNEQSVGSGRVGRLAEPTSLRDFANRVAAVLPKTELGVQVAGSPDAMVQTVAVLPGSGDSMFDDVSASGADVYVTSDLRHHPATDAYQQAQYEARLRGSTGQASQVKPLLINTPHSAIEGLWFRYASQDIHAAIEQATGARLKVQVSTRSTDPWTFTAG